MKLDVQVYHAELLVLNTEDFMNEVKGRMGDTWYNRNQMRRLYQVLDKINFYGSQHSFLLKQTGIADPDILRKLKVLAKIMNNILKYDTTDTLYTLISGFNTVYSGVMSLEW